VEEGRPGSTRKGNPMTRTCPVCTDVDILATRSEDGTEICLCLSCRATWVDRGRGPEEIQPHRARRAPITGPRIGRTAG
jgi:Zn-finger nucleic acid-binding protein